MRKNHVPDVSLSDMADCWLSGMDMWLQMALRAYRNASDPARRLARDYWLAEAQRLAVNARLDYERLRMLRRDCAQFAHVPQNLMKSRKWG